MMWASPLVELIRPSTRKSSPERFASLCVITAATFVAGCTTFPNLQSASVQVAMTDDVAERGGYTDAEKLRRSTLPQVPDFDGPQVAPSARSATPVEIAQKPAEISARTLQPIPGAGQLGSTQSNTPGSVDLPIVRIDAPKPFAWKPAGTTTGNRPFQLITVGDEGYRSLVIGSVAGEDPLAIELVEQLARHLHDGKIILGGFQSTLIRTLNPDGEALHRIFNEKGQYINHGFPKERGASHANEPLEVTFLLEQIHSLQPQRVIHVRTVEGNTGLIATSSGSRPVANDAANWLNFRVIDLPQKAVSGSLERYLASIGNSEIITFAIPSTSKKSELWDRYGDALQNVLLGEDVAARELARQQEQKSSASRRNADGK